MKTEKIYMKIPEWAVCAIEYGDYSDLSDSEIEIIEEFTNYCETMRGNFGGQSWCIDYSDLGSHFSLFEYPFNKLSEYGTVVDAVLTILIDGENDDKQNRAANFWIDCNIQLLFSYSVEGVKQ